MFPGRWRVVPRLAAVGAALALPLTLAAPGSSAVAQEDDGGTPPDTSEGAVPPEPAAWILVDADTGVVLDGHEAHTPQLPASTIKLFTALVAIQRLPADDGVPISARAASMPARKIVVVEGQVWDLEDLLFSMLTVSANDAAVAVAERVGGGSLVGWEVVASGAAERLGLVDHPDFSDPAGLDDQFSNGGGSRISARDMAVVARAVLADPRLREMVAAEEHRFTGGDGIVHVVDRRNQLFTLYEGTIGLETGFTDAAGRCLVAAATRDGRTMVAVLFDAPDMYTSAAMLLDQGFGSAVVAPAGSEVLPAVAADFALDPPVVVPGALAVGLGRVVPAPSSGLRVTDPAAIALLVVGGLPALAVRRRMRAGR